jgi:cytidylate kinase
LSDPSGTEVPVLAIDGPSASGKGAIAERVAQALGFHYLDSGLMYRATALAADRARVSLDDEAALAQLAGSLPVVFTGGTVWLGGEAVTEALRSEVCSENASRVALLPAVREALLDRQRGFRQPPGLVAEGRDMGSVVFPDAALKIFLTASPDARLSRRYKQLMEKGIHANIEKLLEDIRQRDARDFGRAIAPLQVAHDASVLDSTDMTVDAVVSEVIRRYRESGAPLPAQRVPRPR